MRARGVSSHASSENSPGPRPKCHRDDFPTPLHQVAESNAMRTRRLSLPSPRGHRLLPGQTPRRPGGREGGRRARMTAITARGNLERYRPFVSACKGGSEVFPPRNGKALSSSSSPSELGTCQNVASPWNSWQVITVTTRPRSGFREAAVGTFPGTCSLTGGARSALAAPHDSRPEGFAASGEGRENAGVLLSRGHAHTKAGACFWFSECVSPTAAASK